MNILLGLAAATALSASLSHVISPADQPPRNRTCIVTNESSPDATKEVGGRTYLQPVVFHGLAAIGPQGCDKATVDDYNHSDGDSKAWNILPE